MCMYVCVCDTERERERERDRERVRERKSKTAMFDLQTCVKSMPCCRTFLASRTFSSWTVVLNFIIACPLGGHRRRPQAFGMPGCEFVAGHLSRASLEFLEVLRLAAQHPLSLLDPLGVSFEALEALLEPPGVLFWPSWSPVPSSPSLGPIDPANPPNLLFHPLSHFNFTQLNTT